MPSLDLVSVYDVANGHGYPNVAAELVDFHRDLHRKLLFIRLLCTCISCLQRRNCSLEAFGLWWKGSTKFWSSLKLLFVREENNYIRRLQLLIVLHGEEILAKVAPVQTIQLKMKVSLDQGSLYVEVVAVEQWDQWATSVQTSALLIIGVPEKGHMNMTLAVLSTLSLRKLRFTDHSCQQFRCWVCKLQNILQICW